MIVQAIGLLDDLDKELNTYAMRVREWYGWHFPGMSKILSDNVVYAKVVRATSRGLSLVVALWAARRKMTRHVHTGRATVSSRELIAVHSQGACTSWWRTSCVLAVQRGLGAYAVLVSSQGTCSGAASS